VISSCFLSLIGIADSSVAVRNAILHLIVNANGLEVGPST
jgi:hypothetical protein